MKKTPTSPLPILLLSYHLLTTIDLASTVGYLSTEIGAWRECIYCGASKDTLKAVQSYMRDKRHCMLGLDREPELLEFWEVGDDEEEREEEGDEKPSNISAAQMRFKSSRAVE
ncbi:hypothetical protein TWF718_007696 [Orbilia javanica]|uniref:ZN622/Rei1/Reh1 zinc finger C2H2-type domain-containing protein n=1 Tax=Orbilia javanica TaxID=47235 RepID=A0AAN8NSX2_9PEZI